jgi:hypothetical protein
MAIYILLALLLIMVGHKKYVFYKWSATGSVPSSSGVSSGGAMGAMAPLQKHKCCYSY